MLRHSIGTVLTAVGAGTLLTVGLSYAHGALRRDAARAQWNALEAHAAVLASRATLDAPPARLSYEPGALVARLRIPSIDLDEIVTEGVGDDELAAGPGHLPGSATPGEPGNSIISAHRDRHFHSLGHLAVGDTIVTQTLAGQVTWVVIARRVVDRREPALFRTRDATLTLTTCWPIRYIGSAPDRLLITAKPVVHTPRA